MRAMNYHWLASFSFLVYSKRYDSVFYLPSPYSTKQKLLRYVALLKIHDFHWYETNETYAAKGLFMKRVSYQELL